MSSFFLLAWRMVVDSLQSKFLQPELFIHKQHAHAEKVTVAAAYLIHI